MTEGMALYKGNDSALSTTEAKGTASEALSSEALSMSLSDWNKAFANQPKDEADSGLDANSLPNGSTEEMIHRFDPDCEVVPDLMEDGDSSEDEPDDCEPEEAYPDESLPDEVEPEDGPGSCFELPPLELLEEPETAPGDDESPEEEFENNDVPDEEEAEGSQGSEDLLSREREDQQEEDDEYNEGLEFKPHFQNL